MDDQEVYQLFESPLFADLQEQDLFDHQRPILAHYTSLIALESILTNNEILFSNPMFMNDLEEVRFGITQGASAINKSVSIRNALGTDARRARFSEELDYNIQNFAQEHLFDTYVFCLSEHTQETKDGLLSMWRAYGADGRGAAIIFDTSKLSAIETSPLLFMKVNYRSPDSPASWFERIASTFASIFTDNVIADQYIPLAAAILFERLKLHALFTKHHGFSEEKEWRVVYLSDRDVKKRLQPMFHYLNGPRGIEPKLHLKAEPIEGVISAGASFDELIIGILLGPTASDFTKRTVSRMLEKIGKSELSSKLSMSSIPYRPN